MKPLIGIIGGRGQMGRWFAAFFRKEGHKVLIAGRNTSLRPEELAEKCDVVIISVPIHATLDVIKSIGKHVRKGSLLMDLTSIKSAPVRAMLKYSKAQVIGAHPVFGPTVNTIKGQRVVLCPARGRKWMTWLKGLLERNSAKVKITTPENHDKMMSIIQGITHFSSICTGYALKEMGIDVDESIDFTSPIYRLRIGMVGRILNQDPRLYADIEIQNKETIKAVNAYIRSANKLREHIKKKDEMGFVKFFDEAADAFGSFKEEAMDETNYLIEKMVERKK